jgi:hypothetical protein
MWGPVRDARIEQAKENPISRASHEATLFTDDMAKLGPSLGADVSKTSALEINPSPCIAHGIGLGI